MLEGSVTKSVKTELVANKSGDGDPHPKAEVPHPSPKKTQPKASISNLSVSYRGTDRSNPAVKSPTPPVISDQKNPPKKGSFAEIMARANAARSVPTPVGIIKHKPKEKLSSKKELLMQKRAAKLGDQGAARKNSQQGKGSNEVPGAITGNGTIKKEDGTTRKGINVAYKGTAQAKPQPGYKGTMKSTSPNSVSTRKKVLVWGYDSDRSNSAGRDRPTQGQEYEGKCSDEDEEDEEEDYETDVSDMEAGFSDVEEEEGKALKEAKKEDDEQAMMEKEMKRQKEARKRRLVAMADKKAHKRR